MPLLNLKDADTSGFDPIPAGTYDAAIYEAKMDEVKNASGEGKLPAGTPMVKVQFKITEGGEEGEYYNRRVFRNFIIPPEKGYDKAKAAKMKGMFVRFLTAIGYEESEIVSADFDLNLEELAGKECRVVVAVRPATEEYEAQNEVKGVKPAGDSVPAGSLL